MLEEVIVTAQKKTESLQDTPISIIAFSQDDLEKRGYTDISDMRGSVPNLSMAPHPANKNSLTAFIRGVGNADLQVTKDPAVGVYLDGVYLGRSAGLATDIADIAAIEVLRGPQGTLYGRNTTGGAISIRTAVPEETFGFTQVLSAGNRGYWRSLTRANVPVSETLLLRAAYSQSAEDGWVTNAGRGRDFGEDEKQAWRVALRWITSDNLTVDYAYDDSRVDSGQYAYQITRITNANGESFAPFARRDRQSKLSVNNLRTSRDEVFGHSLTATWFVGETLTVKSISAYRELEESLYQDYSASAHHFSGGSFPSMVASGAEILDTVGEKQQQQISQELQFIGSALGDRLDFVSGLYYFEEEGEEEQFASLNLLALGGLPELAEEYYDIDAEAKSLAFFSQLDYTPGALDSRLHFTLGLRYTSDERRASKFDNLYNDRNGATVNGSQDSNRFTPSFTIAYDAGEATNVYAKVATAYRAGGFNVRGTEERFADGFDPEDMLAYEAGIKTELLQRRLRLNAATFLYDYSDLQVDQSDPNNIIATDTVNAGEAEMSGLEVDLTALLSAELYLTVNYGYLDADYKSFVQNGQQVADEKSVPFAPRHSYSVNLDYQRPVTWGMVDASLSYHWEDDYLFSAQGQAQWRSVGLLSATIGLSDISAGDALISLRAWGRNLADEDYIVHEIDWGQSGFVSSAYGEPRSVGVDIKVVFQ